MSNILEDVFLDSQKFFDTVSQKLLKKSGFQAGNWGGIRKWIENYVTGREQSICMSEVNLQMGKIKKWSPSGLSAGASVTFK